MIITIQEARKIIGKQNIKYNDGEIEEIIKILSMISDIAIDDYLTKHKNKKQ